MLKIIAIFLTDKCTDYPKVCVVLIPETNTLSKLARVRIFMEQHYFINTCSLTIHFKKSSECFRVLYRVIKTIICKHMLINPSLLMGPHGCYM